MMVFYCWDGIMSSLWCAVGMVGLCLWSRVRAVVVLRLWTVLCIVISIAFHQVVFS